MEGFCPGIFVQGDFVRGDFVLETILDALGLFSYRFRKLDRRTIKFRD